MRELRAPMHQHRREWARQSVVRDRRLLDAALTGPLTNGVSFDANTTIPIVAASIATVGALDSLVSFAAELLARARRPAMRAHHHAHRRRFDRGIRSDDFGFAPLGGFLHTPAYVALTGLILVVPWRRDFRPKTARALAP